MSCAMLKVVNVDGSVSDYKAYNNAWGGAAYIWSSIYDKYLKRPDLPYDNWMMNADSLWKLSNDESIPMFVRVVLMLTYDRAIVEYDRLPEMAQYLREFLEAFPFPSERSCHLGTWIDDMMDIYEKGDCRGICWHATSVSEDLWEIFEEDKDDEYDGEYRSYNIDSDNDGHWFIFEDLEKSEKVLDK